MKKGIILHIFTLLILTATNSCTNQDDIRESQKQEHQLKFNATLDDEELISRAVTDNSITENGFTIGGFYYEDTPFDETPIDSMQTVFAKEGTPGIYPELKYIDGKFITWTRPWVIKSNSFLTFFAWSSDYKEVGYGITARSGDAEKGYTWLDLSLKAEPLKQKDIVVTKIMDMLNDKVVSSIDLPFQHLLSKISFKAYSPIGIGVKITKFNIVYGANKMQSKGRFTFNNSTSTMGAFTNLNTPYAGSFPLITAPVATTSANNSTSMAAFIGDMVVMPQSVEDGYASIEMTYALEIAPGIFGASIDRTISLKGGALEQGKHYSYILNFTTNDVEFTYIPIMAWGTESQAGMPVIMGPRGEVMLLLDATEPPYTASDGKKYWLDRSGYNRHCELKGAMGNSVTTGPGYYTTEKYYKFPNNTTDYISVPPIGILQEATIQIIAMTTTENSGLGSLFWFTSPGQESIGNNRNLFTHFTNQMDNQITFDSGPGDKSYNTNWGRLGWDAGSRAPLIVPALYTFRKGEFFQAISRNDIINVTVTHPNPQRPGECNYNRIGYSFAGTVKYFKLIHRSIPRNEVLADFRAIKAKYNLPDDVPVATSKVPTLTPDLRNSLIAFFHPDEPLTTDNDKCWKDQSGNGNDLEVIGTGIMYDAIKKSVIFPGSNGNDCLKFVKSLGALPEYTIVYYLKRDASTTGDRILMNFTDNPKTFNSNGAAWYFPSAGGKLHCLAGAATIWFDDINPNYRSYAFTRNKDGNVSTIREGDQHRWTFSGTVTPLSLDHCYIGNASIGGKGYKGAIKAIYLFNREISITEIRTIRDQAVRDYGTNF